MIEAALEEAGAKRGCGGLLPVSGVELRDLRDLLRSGRINPRQIEFTDDQLRAMHRLVEPISQQIEEARVEFKFEFARVQLQRLGSGRFETHQGGAVPSAFMDAKDALKVSLPGASVGDPRRHLLIPYSEEPVLAEQVTRAFSLSADRDALLRDYVAGL